MKFAKTLKVKSPERGTSKAAGIDFFIPEFTEEFIKLFTEKNTHYQMDTLNKTITLKPHDRLLIPSGIHVKFDDNYMLAVHNKSGVASKKGLDRLAEIIDADYSGMIHISLVNTSNQVVTIKENEKIVQMILIPILYAIPEETTYDDLQEMHKESERGHGGFGSTGK